MKYALIALALGVFGLSLFPLSRMISLNPSSNTVGGDAEVATAMTDHGDDVQMATTVTTAENGDDKLGSLDDEMDHLATVTGVPEHEHAETSVDPSAPVVHVFALEFGYTPGHFEVESAIFEFLYFAMSWYAVRCESSHRAGYR